MSAGAVRQFERGFADWLGVPHAFAFWKARVAEYAILRGLGVSRGDEVILPGYTCVMDVNPIKYLGARPVYVDIEPATYNTRPEDIAQAVTPRTKVIVAQHTYGYPCEMDGIMELSRRRGIPVVEDCCHALGSTYRGKVCGTFGQAAYWSFQWNKPFTTGLGGLATVNDRALAERIREICDKELRRPPRTAMFMLAMQRAAYRLLIYPRSTALAAMLFRWLTRKGLVVGSSGRGEYEPVMAESFLTGMGSWQAQAGMRQLRKIEKNIAHRRRMKAIYDDLFRQTGWPVAELPGYMDPVLVRYPVRVADKARAVAEAPRHFVEIGTWFECPLHAAEGPLEPYEYRMGQCPESERACREVVNLPTHPRAGKSTTRRSVEFLRRVRPADPATQ